MFSSRLICFYVFPLSCYYLSYHINCLPNEAAYCIILRECMCFCSLCVSVSTALINHTSSIIFLFFVWDPCYLSLYCCLMLWATDVFSESCVNLMSANWVSLRLRSAFQMHFECSVVSRSSVGGGRAAPGNTGPLEPDISVLDWMPHLSEPWFLICEMGMIIPP